MARHLIESRDLVGRSKDYILTQLGATLTDRTEGGLEWYLGRRKGGASLMWDYEGYLVVTLNDRGECEKAYIYERD